MTFDRLNRRTHLYLGVLLVPWFFMYGPSSVVFNHGGFFWDLYGHTEPKWIPQYERAYRMPPIKEDDDEWALGEKVMNDAGLHGRYRPHVDDDGVLTVFNNRFLGTTRIRYYPDRQRLVVDRAEFRLDRFLTGMHVRGGWAWPGFLEYFWSSCVDLVILSTLMWVLSGLYIWWKLKRFRFWGAISLVAGCLCFVGFMIGL